ncbi:kinase-like domain-containing protein [Mycena capillaripes]|nr:kinase-like domain-containing protein [Mycena capillaripes]
MVWLRESSLGPKELDWARYQPLLEERGYMLRRRYRPGWIPSPRHLRHFVTSLSAGAALDATRICDQAQVVLKIVKTESLEVRLTKFLTDHLGASKHVIPVLELIVIPDNCERAFIVMPRMRQCNETPYFTTIGEFTEFVQQGLVYLHSNNIAHRDICPKNIVVDASRMIPSGFHFVRVWTSDGVQRIDRECMEREENSTTPFMITRREAGPMNYYFIDFGLSAWDASFQTRGLVTGLCGQRAKYIPEISETVPYDPFKVDVRSVGEMLRKDFLMNYTGLDFVIPFVRKLRRHDPTHRPDAVEALALFQRLVSKMSEEQLAKPIKKLHSQKRKMWLFLRGVGRPWRSDYV